MKRMKEEMDGKGIYISIRYSNFTRARSALGNLSPSANKSRKEKKRKITPPSKRKTQETL